MLAMYQAYSMQRPGRPKWALAASGLALILTVGMAAGLIQYKHSVNHVPLGKAKLYEQGGLRTRLPSEWNDLPFEKLPAGVIAAAQEPTAEGEGSRDVFVFRADPSPLGVPAFDGLEAVARLAQSLVSGSIDQIAELDEGPIGDLPGATFYCQVYASWGRGAKVICLARVAVAPDGQTVGVLMRLGRQYTGSDETLLDRISRDTHLTQHRIADNAKNWMQQAGIQFEPPSNALFYAEKGRAEQRIRMMASTQPMWYVDLYRVPLIKDATLHGLVEDAVRATLQQISLENRVGREAETSETVRLVMPIDATDHKRLIVQGLPVDDTTAVLMIGRCEKEATTTLERIFDAIAETRQIDPIVSFVSVPDALENGLRCLTNLQRAGLGSVLRAWEGEDMLYHMRTWGLTLGGEEQVYQHFDRDDRTFWSVRSNFVRELTRQSRALSRDRWSIRDDGMEHKADYEVYLQKSARGGVKRERLLRYHETRQAGSDEVEWTYEGTDARYDTTTDLDAHYVCEPMMLMIAARLANEPEPRPAILSTTETFAKNLSYWLLLPTPLDTVREQVPIGDWDSLSIVGAVRVIRPHNPSPFTLCFDEEGRLQLWLDEGVWLRLASDEVDNVLPDTVPEEDSEVARHLGRFRHHADNWTN